jgi:RNA methyltransferase, TrmH family
MQKIIHSSSNPEVKDLHTLKVKARVRKERGMFLVEGRREFERAWASGFALKKKFRCESILRDSDPWYSNYKNMEAEEVLLDGKAFEKLATREGSGGIIGLFENLDRKLSGFDPGKDPLILVLDGIEKPGNIGAIFRTADGAGASAIFLSNFPGDLYNPNTIRASLGCIFSIPFYVDEPKAILKFLADQKIEPFVAIPGKKRMIHECDFSGASAMVFGSENQGVTSEYENLKNAGFTVPMNGIADSLNVSVSVGIVIYEAIRQRITKDKIN